MGRKKQFTEEQIIKALRASGGFISPAAKMLNTTYHTVYAYIKEYESIAQVKKEIEESYLDIAETSLISMVKERQVIPTIFYLKTKGKSRGYVERMELGNEDGKPFAIILTKNEEGK